MPRCYISPVRKRCNADCTFCFTKTLGGRDEPEYLSPGAILENAANLASMDEFEITGGGEPTLHKKLQTIVDNVRTIKPSIYIKMYTNGFFLPPISGIDEINISRCHWDTGKNNEIYRAKQPTDLRAVVDHYRPRVTKVRVQTVLLKGYVDSREAMLEFVERYPDVDVFMFRPLFSKCDSEKHRFVDLSIEHPRVKMDVTGDTYGDAWSISMGGQWQSGMPFV